MAQFLAANSFDNEVEFYQDDWLPRGERPSATIAVYDSLWGEVEKREGQVFRIGEDKDSDHWLARHRITVMPGKYNYTVRMASRDEKWLGKGELEFAPFSPDSLQISAVVLGTEPVEGLESPDRLGVRFVPRPTTQFGRGEPVSVYLEIYGLHPDSTGRRHYKQWIDVVRLEEGESRIKKYAGKVFQILTFNLNDPRTTVSLSFEREADWRGDRAPERFTLDTSELQSGAYRLVLQVRDNVSGLWDVEEVFLDIEGKAEAALKEYVSVIRGRPRLHGCPSGAHGTGFTRYFRFDVGARRAVPESLCTGEACLPPLRSAIRAATGGRPYDRVWSIRAAKGMRRCLYTECRGKMLKNINWTNPPQSPFAKGGGPPPGHLRINARMTGI